ncbi:MAG: hypothetical protein ACE15D_10615 [Candidatus Eisenbacteria bacterium]
MPLETFSGTSIPALLARAEETIGEDAVVLEIRRRSGGRGAAGHGPHAGEGAAAWFELVAGDPASAVSMAGNSPASRPTPVPFPIPERAKRGGRPFVLALVGPTGGGKTTTIAKLASHPQAFGGKSCAVLTLDSHRVGAIEQSRQFAALSGIPFAAAYEPTDLPDAVRRLRGCDVLLVDTPGRGPGRRAEIGLVREMLRALAPDEVHLALPAGLHPRLARRWIAEHRADGVTHLLPTKLDEFGDDPSIGSIAELASEHELAMRWASDGQEIPGDLRQAPRAGTSGRPQ